jgi:two-component system chemotaxis sensor kinase CheA
MSAPDEELRALLVAELVRHLATIEDGAPTATDPDTVRQALHSSKGSAGIAGERELSRALEVQERLAPVDLEGARREGKRLLTLAIARLKKGQTAVPATWPVPPSHVRAVELSPEMLAQYTYEMRDRLAVLDEALSSGGSPRSVADEGMRHVHTMKGAASAVGDEPMSWFCHGLEQELQSARRSGDDAGAVRLLVRYRWALGQLLEDSPGALDRLRAGSIAPQRTPSDVAIVAVNPPPMLATIRVSSGAIDRLAETTEATNMARERVTGRIERSQADARLLRRTRASLTEALRLIGPPRPWGAPAAAIERIARAADSCRQVADELIQSADMLRDGERILKTTTEDCRREISAMRLTSMGALFSKLTAVVESESRRTGRAIIVQTRGADTPVDRQLGERIVEPCLHLVRNAVAHGIETAEVRASMGKAVTGTITFAARSDGRRLIVSIADDGPGVNFERVREGAVSAGLVSREVADAADQDALLEFLFLPGFSTAESADLLAGRGVGLDVVRALVERIGGTIRITTREGAGVNVFVEVPTDVGVHRVLWVRSQKDEFAIDVSNVQAIDRLYGADRRRVPHLSFCLESTHNRESNFALSLEAPSSEGTAIVRVGVDEILRVEEAVRRPRTRLLSAFGPYAGFVVRGHGGLALVLDAYALVPLIRARGGVLEPKAAPLSGKSLEGNGP